MTIDPDNICSTGPLQHQQSQPDHDRREVPVPRHAAAARSGAEIYHLKEPEKLPLTVEPQTSRRGSIPWPAAC
jgi:hypothetical protein